MALRFWLAGVAVLLLGEPGWALPSGIKGSPALEPPVGKVTSMSVSEGEMIFVCHVNGFYPAKIEATWRKGGEIVEQDTFRGSVTRNLDGTYHASLGVEMDLTDRGLYQCHIQHVGLPEPLVLAWEAPGGNQTQ
ncbi:saoe class I histocompatibility antigen, A alpha chain-like [Pogona vitticeps]